MQQAHSRPHRLLRAGHRDPTAAGLCALTIMTKAPRAGQVKTRLTPPLTREEAAALNSCFLQDTALAISKAGVGMRGIGCFTPVGSEYLYGDLFPPEFALIAQRESSFGERLFQAAEDLFSVGFASVCLIDSDSPTVASSVFAEAVEKLTQPNDQVILGPCEDGGYYLIGLKKLHRRLFEQIDWSTEQVFHQTLERAAALRLPVHLLPTYYDVDDAPGLRRLYQELLQPNDKHAAQAAPVTTDFLRRLIVGKRREQIFPTISEPAEKR